MRTIKLAFAFVFMFLVGMSVNTVSLNSGGISIETSVVEAAQQATTTTTKSSSSSSTNKAKKMKVTQVDLGLVTDKSPIENLFLTFDKWIRGFTIVFSVLAGLCLFIAGGLSLKLQAEQGSVKHPTEKIIATFLAATIIMNFWLALAWFVPNANSGCTLQGFQSRECGNTEMTVTGGLYDEIVGAQGSASSTGTPGKLDFLGESVQVLNAVSYLIMALGAASFISCMLLMKGMFSGDKKRDLGLLGRVGFASIVIVNHRALIEGCVETAKLVGVWS